QLGPVGLDVAVEPGAAGHVAALEDEDEAVGAGLGGLGRPGGRLGQHQRDAGAVLDGGVPGTVVVGADHHDLVVGPWQLADDVVGGDGAAVGLDGEVGPDRAGGQQVAQLVAGALVDPPGRQRAGDGAVGGGVVWGG